MIKLDQICSQDLDQGAKTSILLWELRLLHSRCIFIIVYYDDTTYVASILIRHTDILWELRLLHSRWLLIVRYLLGCSGKRLTRLLRVVELDFFCHNSAISWLSGAATPSERTVWESNRGLALPDSLTSSSPPLTRLTTTSSPQTEAEVFADFLNPMLDLNHERRVSAAECLKHDWLKGV